jgi:hypothetical protein
VVDEELGAIPYQLIHRVASVCSVPARRHALIYQLHVVNASNFDHYKSDLHQLSRAIAAAGHIDLWLHRITLSRTPAYHETERLIESASPLNRPMVIRNALLTRHLFNIEHQRLEQVI